MRAIDRPKLFGTTNTEQMTIATMQKIQENARLRLRPMRSATKPTQQLEAIAATLFQV